MDKAGRWGGAHWTKVRHVVATAASVQFEIQENGRM